MGETRKVMASFSPALPPAAADFSLDLPMSIVPAPRSADWSMMLDMSSASNANGSGVGAIVQGLEDVAQCIRIILTTPKGSDPLRPTFACDLFAFIDMPMDRAVPQIVAAVYDAIERWEPRVKLMSVSAVPDPGNLGGLIISVTWQLNLPSAQGLARTTTITLGGAS